MIDIIREVILKWAMNIENIINIENENNHAIFVNLLKIKQSIM